MAATADQIPEHRNLVESRSGDTHEIRKDGKRHNVDQEARDAAAKPKRAPVAKKPAAKRKRAAKASPAPSPAPAPATAASGDA